MVLLSILSVLNTAFEADLVFVDPAKGRLVPVNQWLEGVLNPVVGIGLLFLLGRNLLENRVMWMETPSCSRRSCSRSCTVQPLLEFLTDGGILPGEVNGSGKTSKFRSLSTSTRFPTI